MPHLRGPYIVGWHAGWARHSLCVVHGAAIDRPSGKAKDALALGCDESRSPVFMRNLFVWTGSLISDTMVFFYAVARGRNPGVYSTWKECKAQVFQFPAAAYKKFPSKAEAENFVDARGGSSSSKRTAPEGRLKKSETDSLHDEMEKKLKNWATSASKFSLLDVQAQSLRIASDLGIQRFDPQGGWLKHHVECNPSIYKTSFRKCAESADDASPEEDAKLLEKLCRLESRISGLSTAGRAIPDRIKLLERTLFSMKRKLDGIKRCMSTNVRENAGIAASRKRKRLANSEEDATSDDASDRTNDNPEAPDEFVVDSEGYVNVYTDGACSGNGKSRAAAGIGVWFGDGHPLNISQPITDGSRATNNLAEIQAVTAAARQASRAGVKKLKINTDSQFLISCITQWMPKWKRNGWKTSGGKDVINKEELVEMETAVQPLTIAWNHVRGHAGIHGNEMADKLARAGAERHKN